MKEVFDNLPEDARYFEFDFLVRGQSMSVEVASVESEGGDLAKGSLDTPEQVIGWLDYPGLQMALLERQLESETLGLGTFLLLETMAFLTRQPEIKGVRIVFRAERKDA